MPPTNYRFVSLHIITMVAATLCILGIVAFLTIQYLESKKSIEVVFSSVKDVALVEFRTLKKVGKIDSSGDVVDISKDTRYKLTYIGKDGFADGEVVIDNTKDKVSINPFYSDKKLDTLLTDTSVNSIHKAIRDKYTSIIDEYAIQRGKLYHFGEWYSTSLVYKKGYSDISDTLYIIAQKTPEGWKIVADPNITFDKISNPNIPIDILNQINNPSS